MYVPEPFRISEDEAEAFIRNNGFASLITHSAKGLVATHLPLRLSETNGLKVLRGHLAKANAHWRNWKEGDPALAIFLGPHTYISSSWYDHENVPTWNYQAVHVRGPIRLTALDETVESLKELTDNYEKGNSKPVRVDGMSKTFFNREIRGIVGFEVRIETIEAAFKLSQNRDARNYQEIIRQLEGRGDAESKQVAAAMKKADPAKASSKSDGR